MQIPKDLAPCQLELWDEGFMLHVLMIDAVVVQEVQTVCQSDLLQIAEGVPERQLSD